MTPLSRLLVSAAMAAGLSSCAALPHFIHWVKIRPISSAPSQTAHREDGYYGSAKAAIARRDYARALDLLQAARDAKPDDVRTLNAFGVVYDKLGRFDLSARYYAEAKALDPTSPILANNMAYSASLRVRATAGAPAAESVQLASLTAPTAPTPQAQTAVFPPVRPAVIRLGFAAPRPAAQPTLVLAGRALEVEDATGRKDGAAPVVQGLIRLGWTSPKLEAHAAARKVATIISYPARAEAVAKALARTLPAGVQLVDCQAGCDGLRLTLGADAAKWTLASLGQRKGRGQ
jgi:tetratricopeptide (TPR) repeat protein